MYFKEVTYKESQDLGKGWKTAGATVELSHGEDPEKAFHTLKEFVISKLGGTISGTLKQELPPVIPGNDNSKKETKKPATSKPKKPKVVAYDRNVELHKDTLSELLEGVLGENWFEAEGVVDKAKALSESATKDKVDFMDDKGNVLDSFKELIAKEFGGAKTTKPSL